MPADTKNVADPLAAADPLAVAGYSSGAVVQSGATQVASGAMLADSEVIPVLRETVQVSKREVETGRVVVHKTVTERDEAVEVLLKRTDISVERIPVNRVVTEAPSSRQDGDTLIIPILEEVLVVEKRLVLKEELHIRKDSSERTVHETVRLRSEEVRIEQTHGDQASTDQASTDQASTDQASTDQAGATIPATHPEA